MVIWYAYWRSQVIYHATPEGLECECVSAYETHFANGDKPPGAAWCALYDWDI